MRLTHFIVYCAFVFLFASTLAQMSPSQQTAPSPLSVSDVEHGLKSGVSNGRMTALVKQYGVDFELTDAVEQKLRVAGANGDLLLEITRAKRPQSGRVTAVPESTEDKSAPQQGAHDPSQVISANRDLVNSVPARAEPTRTSVDSQAKWSSWATSGFLDARTHCTEGNPALWDVELRIGRDADLRWRVVNGSASGSGTTMEVKEGQLLRIGRILTKDCNNLHVQVAMNAFDSSYRYDYENGKLKAKVGKAGGGLGFWGAVGAGLQGAAAGMGGTAPPTTYPTSTPDDSAEAPNSGGSSSPIVTNTSSASSPSRDSSGAVQLRNSCIKATKAGIGFDLTNTCSVPLSVSVCFYVQGARCWTCNPAGGNASIPAGATNHEYSECGLANYTSCNPPSHIADIKWNAVEAPANPPLVSGIDSSCQHIVH